MNLITSCPWSQFQPDPHPFCEEQLCAWIGQPANTWSNIGYLVTAYLLFKDNTLSPRHKIFSLFTLFLFIGSSLFHMSNNMWAKKFDVGAMLLLSSLTLTVSLVRRFEIQRQKEYLLFSFFFISSFTAVGVGRVGGILFLIQSVLSVFWEYKNFHKLPDSSKLKKHIFQILWVFPIALVLNMLDQYRVLCIPDNHIFTVHGLWHLACAYCLYWVGRYYCDPSSSRF